MTLTTRPAGRADLDPLADLLCHAARGLAAREPALWPLVADPETKIRATLERQVAGEDSPLRQRWLLAEDGGELLGAVHSFLLPVPPIYAGALGSPGLILQDAALVPNAPEAARATLLAAAEADLAAAGALILLTASVAEGDWLSCHAAQGYHPLTLYLAKAGLAEMAVRPPIRSAAEGDVPAIVGLSATHRRIIADLHPQFWQTHEAADARFGGWMTRSLGLADRDMFVAGEGAVQGYAISQPITAMHVSAGHRIAGIGIIDDFYHAALEDPLSLGTGADEAAALLRTAEAARQARGDGAVFVVCPAAWRSKIALLEQSGYRTALIWSIKILD